MTKGTLPLGTGKRKSTVNKVDVQSIEKHSKNMAPVKPIGEI